MTIHRNTDKENDRNPGKKGHFFCNKQCISVTVVSKFTCILLRFVGNPVPDYRDYGITVYPIREIWRQETYENTKKKLTELNLKTELENIFKLHLNLIKH